MKLQEAPKFRFGINHRGGSKPAIVKQKDLSSGEKPEKPKPKKKSERQNRR